MRAMRLALAQINPTVGDIDANAERIVSFAHRAAEEGADLVVFPELCVTGYPPRDLLLQEGFVEAAEGAADRLAGELPRGLTAVVGLPLRVGGRRNGQTNTVLVLRGGERVARYDKRLLPTYDVFDEDRYFCAGDRPVIVEVAGVRVGLSICEDLWKGEDAGFADRYAAAPDPVGELATPLSGEPGARVIVSPSASPFVLGKAKRHHALLSGHASRHRVYVASVNQVGGNDELIFDGHATVYGPDGSLVAGAPGFVEHLLVHGVGESGEGAVAAPRVESSAEELLTRALVLGVRDYCRKTGFRSAVIGLSGGIDSAVTAVIAAAALGPQNVMGVSMPSRYSSPGSVGDAVELARRVGIPHRTIPIERAFGAFEESLAGVFAGRAADVTEENIQSRVRGTLLMAISNKFGSIVLTTGNKSELAVGYCTLYGDMNGGLAVLSDVTKQRVYAVAEWINAHFRELGLGPLVTEPPIPEETIRKPPSAELRPDQKDEDTLPPYGVVDEIVSRYVESRQSPRRIVAETGFDGATVARVVRLIDVSEYKRKQAALGLKVTGVAFGSGRRFPIAQRYRPEHGLGGD